MNTELLTKLKHKEAGSGSSDKRTRIQRCHLSKSGEGCEGQQKGLLQVYIISSRKAMENVCLLPNGVWDLVTKNTEKA